MSTVGFTGLRRQHIADGATSDALIAETARHHGLTLYSLDRRARPVHDAIDVDVVWIGDPE